LPESNAKNGQQTSDVIHDKSAISRILAPMHFGPDGAEKFLMLQIH
jgi:hypothetical protein